MSIEPDGDACETGHFVEVGIEGVAVWADMTPWPARFGGAVPHQLNIELGLAGWVVQRDGADPDPIDCVCGIPEFWSDEDRAMAALPARRLVAFGDTDDVGSWAARVVHAIDRVLAPRSSRWFVTGTAEALQGGALADHPRNGRGEFFGRWNVDLAEVQQPGACERAVWPMGTESAALVCAMGLHQYHEGPCPEVLPTCEGLGDLDGDDDRGVW